MKKTRWRTGESLPTSAQLEKEFCREKSRRSCLKAARNIVCVLILAAAVLVLASGQFFPVMKISGNSMGDTLHDGDIVISLKDTSLETGDVVVLCCDSKILIRRVIAGFGDLVEIGGEGRILINGRLIDEPYASEWSLKESSTKLPFWVPYKTVFVTGEEILYSPLTGGRYISSGFIRENQITGRIVFRIWPLTEFGFVK
ncbi:MAG: signal peptidase I [Lachnospiraceae bacterium]|nr:signal peptidase I [Lachnospiraceae bacterium]